MSHNWFEVFHKISGRYKQFKFCTIDPVVEEASYFTYYIHIEIINSISLSYQFSSFYEKRI